MAEIQIRVCWSYLWGAVSKYAKRISEESWFKTRWCFPNGRATMLKNMISQSLWDLAWLQSLCKNRLLLCLPSYSHLLFTLKWISLDSLEPPNFTLFKFIKLHYLFQFYVWGTVCVMRLILLFIYIITRDLYCTQTSGCKSPHRR